MRQCGNYGSAAVRSRPAQYVLAGALLRIARLPKLPHYRIATLSNYLNTMLRSASSLISMNSNTVNVINAVPP
jgi:hypothetical protein